MIPQIEKLKAYIEKKQFSGYDPYDALNSPVLRGLSFGNKYLRVIFTQGLKRLPVNLRPIIFLPKGYNPKGLGLFLSGYAKLYTLEKNPNYLIQIDKLVDLLDRYKTTSLRDLRFHNQKGICSRNDRSGHDKNANKCMDSSSRFRTGCLPEDGNKGHGWGYNFNWQSRVFLVPQYTPTVVNSSFIGHALMDTFALTGLAKAREMALPIGNFIIKGLHRLEEEGTICFSYTPIDYYFVHNANLLGASLLIRLYQETGNEEFKKTALFALAYSMKHQLADGSWFYAEKDTSRWIDSFHTGFNLLAIKYFIDLGFAEEFRPQFEKGVCFYATKFFLEDGTPKYFHDRVYPIDIHSAAQAIAFFSGMGEPYRVLTKRIVDWTLKNMFNKKGYFYFQKHRFYTNKIPYMRWSQAWMFHALAEYALNNK